jgi:hypothetical protein
MEEVRGECLSEGCASVGLCAAGHGLVLVCIAAVPSWLSLPSVILHSALRVHQLYELMNQRTRTLCGGAGDITSGLLSD